MRNVGEVAGLLGLDQRSGRIQMPSSMNARILMNTRILAIAAFALVAASPMLQAGPQPVTALRAGHLGVRLDTGLSWHSMRPL